MTKDDNLAGRNYLCQNKRSMLRRIFIMCCIVAGIFIYSPAAKAQCSICTKTAQQLGEKPAKALNTGIVYLAAMPFLIFSYIGYRWWKNNRDEA